MNEVQQKTNASLPANVFEQDASKGLGNIGQQDLALPFLKILGQLSPEVNERDGKYVKGAKAGMIFNSVTGELYDGFFLSDQKSISKYIQQIAISGPCLKTIII